MRSRQHSALTGVLVVVALLLSTPGIARTQTPAQATQTDARGGITIKAVYVTSAYFKAAPADPLAGKVDLERSIVIAVTLDTHAGNLAGYDLVRNASLRNDRGQQARPVRWVAT